MNKLTMTANVILEIIENVGYEAYIVGGAPRDLLMGIDPSDIDIATNCPISMLDNLFMTYEIGKSKDFGIVGVYLDGHFFEIANYRIDGVYKDNRRPSSVEIASTLREDVARRDFTINALAMDRQERIVDYVNGKQDIDEGIIRAVGNAYARFQEDPVRMVRAARFAARFNFSIEKGTKLAIKDLSLSIQKVTPERLRLEIKKAAAGSSESFARFIELLEELRLLPKFLPEISAMKYLPQNKEYHPEGNVFEHTVASIRCVRNDFIDAPLTRIATLFHDIGKTTTYKYEDNKEKYHGHAESGTLILAEICSRLKFTTIETDALTFTSKYHMVYRDAIKMKPAKVARLLDSPYFAMLVEVCRADDLSRGDAFYNEKEFEDHYQKVLKIKHKWEDFLTTKPKRLVSGEQIMELLSISPGRLVGEIKRRVEDRIINESIDYSDINKVEECIKEEAEKLYQEV